MDRKATTLQPTPEIISKSELTSLGITHSRCHERFADFSAAMLTFLREEVPRKWTLHCDAVSDSFRVISPEDFRTLA
jgi:hypothetical protein